MANSRPSTIKEDALDSLRLCQRDSENVIETLTSVTLDFIDYNVDPSRIKQMESAMLTQALVSSRVERYIEALEMVKNDILQEQEQFNPASRFNEYLRDVESLSEEDMKSHPIYLKYMGQLQTMREEVGVYSAKDGNNEGFTILTNQRAFICPITQVTIKQPVKNRKCGHNYEESAVREMIRLKHRDNKRVRCPHVGCEHEDMHDSDLEPDRVLQHLIEQSEQKK
uniref:E3 SUMO-protein ligase NSE2 isoform X1 n=2 Tax=Myxine glutinosa TaxID=7769 RepID=UPI00358DEB8C